MRAFAYSNIGSVLHYLVRVMPFTQFFVTFQGALQCVVYSAGNVNDCGYKVAPLIFRIAPSMTWSIRGA